MKKYDIIMNYENCRWFYERRDYLIRTMKEFFFEWHDENRKEPQCCYFIVGIQNYDMINDVKMTIAGLDIEVECSWEHHPDYLELSIK